MIMAPASALAPDDVGLGLRRALLGPLRATSRESIDFIEVGPENWMGVGGALGDAFEDIAQRWPLVCHGLSLSLGGPGELDAAFLLRLRRFLDTHRAVIYSEHLASCTDGQGQLYDLMPLPFNRAAVDHVSARLRQVQDALGRRIAIENISYYATLDTGASTAMREVDFIGEVLERADCDLLLDVNNIVVNATNHGYDAHEFLRALPAARVAYIHVAGHHDEPDGLKIDTHGAAVSIPVWEALDAAYAHCGPRPTLLERDFDLPPFDALLGELDDVRARVRGTQARRHAA
jgi:uncharacterized protein (UPF0276 family)